MAEPRHWHLVMYDISEPKRWREIHKIIVAWGNPIQYSVFRVRGTERDMEKLRFELTSHLAEDDRLTIVRLCDSCADRVTVRGKQMSPLDKDTPDFRLA